MDRLMEQDAFGFFAHAGCTYLDSAATSLVPERVLDAMVRYYREVGGAAGRSAHLPGTRASALVEDSRERCAAFFNCNADELIFVANATDGINAVAQGLTWAPGDRVLVSLWEHHANLLPWMRLRERYGVFVDVVEPDEGGNYGADVFRRALAGPPVKLLAFTHRSNVLGTPTDAAAICRAARDTGVMTLVDGAQSAPHEAVDFQALGADFFVMSAHKALGPKGTGVLIARADVQDLLTPWRLGGGIVADVDRAGYRLAAGPCRYETGTANVGAIAGTAEALTILGEIGMARVAAHDRALGAYLRAGLKDIATVTVFGTDNPHLATGTCAFAIAGVPPHRAASLYDHLGNVAVRSGHHCALPLTKEILRRREGSVRASLYVYNAADDVDRFLGITKKIARLGSKQTPARDSKRTDRAENSHVQG